MAKLFDNVSKNLAKIRENEFGENREESDKNENFAKNAEKFVKKNVRGSEKNVKNVAEKVEKSEEKFAKKFAKNVEKSAKNPEKNSSKKDKKARRLHFDYVFSTPNVDPFSEITWEKRDVQMTNWKTGEITFEQKNVEFPDFWSLNASQIVTTKYFRGTLGTPERENSLKQLISRVVGKYVAEGKKDDYFADEKSAKVFENELKFMLLHQIFSFNSPVWFNVGTDAPQQVSACFILGVDDSMESILNWYVEEGRIFKRGSGAGVNLSRIRGAKEGLSTGGQASGPVSFMRGADASAGTIASGGATRRAAKMVVLDIDHPDIESFIQTKVREEEKIRALKNAGFDMDVDGKDIYSVQYQNANNSVRVSDEFMRAVEAGAPFGLRARRDGAIIETLDARDLFREIAEAAWACADPGIQYDDTINAWHTIPAEGKITASNPCSEYMSIDNSSCNLASINLLKFLGENNKFDFEKFSRAVEIIFTAMDLSVSFGDFPTEKITENTRKFRQLGIGFANLGALLMAVGLPYDSPEGQKVAAAITSLMTATAYRRSAEIAAATQPFYDFSRNAGAMTNVLNRHAKESLKLTDEIVDKNLHLNAEEIVFAANREWENSLKLGAEFGWRNSQASLLAPTGTIGFMMDCDTTGIEPDFSLVKFKKLVGGGSMQIVNQTIPRALKTLGYDDAETAEIVEFIAKNGNVIGAPHLNLEHYAVFDCAVGDRAIAPMGHIRMMAAVQPFLSGAISKTVNMPETATVKEVEEVYLEGWKLGLKAIAIYRNNCKASQPLSASKVDDETDEKSDENSTEIRENSAENETEIREKLERKIRAEITEKLAKENEVFAKSLNENSQAKLFDDAVMRGTKISLPEVREGKTYKYEIRGMSPLKGYITTGKYADGKLGEVFLKVAKQGSTLAGLMDAFSIAVSMGLQYGVPLEKFVEKFANIRFEPSGPTGDAEIPNATSPIDYIFRRLALDNLDFDTRSLYGIYTTRERAHAVANGGFYEELTEEIEENRESFGDENFAKKSEEAQNDFAKIEAEKSEFASENSSEIREKSDETSAAAPNDGQAAAAGRLRKIAAEIVAKNPENPTEIREKVENSAQNSRNEAHSTAELMEKMGVSDDAPMCMNCGVKMRPAGSCFICELCGSTSGCS